MRTVPERPEAAEFAQETLEWLADNRDADNVRDGLTLLAKVLPEHWFLVEAMLVETLDWLARHRHGGHRIVVLVRALNVAAEYPSAQAAGEIAAEARSWLTDNPDHPRYPVVLIGLNWLAGAFSSIDVHEEFGREVIGNAQDWLAAHPEADNVRIALEAAPPMPV